MAPVGVTGPPMPDLTAGRRGDSYSSSSQWTAGTPARTLHRHSRTSANDMVAPIAPFGRRRGSPAEGPLAARNGGPARVLLGQSPSLTLRQCIREMIYADPAFRWAVEDALRAL